MITPETTVEVCIRRMTLEDVEQVYALDVLSFALPWSERSYRFELTENKNSRSWVAEARDAEGRGRVVGMIVAWVILDEAHIATLAVQPEFRRMGLGRRLLAQTLADVTRSGAAQAYLEVRRSNLAAQELYRRFGFLVNGERPRYYLDNNEDALLMMLYPIQIDLIRQMGGPDPREDSRFA